MSLIIPESVLQGSWASLGKSSIVQAWTVVLSGQQHGGMGVDVTSECSAPDAFHPHQVRLV